MAQYIEMSPDQVRSEATRLMNLKQQHDAQMQRMSSIINSTSEIWKGGAQQSYIDKFNEMQKDFQRFSEMLQKFSELIKSSADEIEEANIQSANNTETIQSAR